MNSEARALDRVEAYWEIVETSDGGGLALGRIADLEVQKEENLIAFLESRLGNHPIIEAIRRGEHTRFSSGVVSKA